jgi:hypothetical protein
MALSQTELRLLALETLVAFQFAGRHLQTNDPAAAVAQLRQFLAEEARDPLFPHLGAADAAAVSAELEQTVGRILRLQKRIPARLVD